MVGPRLIQLLFFNRSPAYFMKLDYFLTYVSVLNVHLFLSCLMVLAAEPQAKKTLTLRPQLQLDEFLELCIPSSRNSWG
jgi:hypothetical protein